MNRRINTSRRAMTSAGRQKPNLLIALIKKIFLKKKKSNNSIYPLR
ncbi:hypothetical protein BCh11DRAFT_03913 [Burkholderia sp. Ch1-1]|nr:hypothetical protein BCh11DRAFT_03913 [Burkholderia sp. Ch1-1]